MSFRVLTKAHLFPGSEEQILAPGKARKREGGREGKRERERSC